MRPLLALSASFEVALLPMRRAGLRATPTRSVSEATRARMRGCLPLVWKHDRAAIRSRSDVHISSRGFPRSRFGLRIQEIHFSLLKNAQLQNLRSGLVMIASCVIHECRACDAHFTCRDRRSPSTSRRWETFGRAEWHGQETVPQHVPQHVCCPCLQPRWPRRWVVGAKAGAAEAAGAAFNRSRPRSCRPAGSARRRGASARR